MLSIDYVAGFFDGEGCIMFAQTKGHYYPKAIFYNSNLNIMRALEYTLNSWGIDCRYRKRSKQNSIDGRKDQYVISLQNMDAIYLFCQIVRQALKIKQPHAEAVIRFIEAKRIDARDEQLKDVKTQAVMEVKSLNR